MPLYEWKCPNCRTISSTLTYGVVPTCQVCAIPKTRIYSFYVEKTFVPHFNTSVGKYVSSQRQFNEELKLLGEAETARTGIYHNYIPQEQGDAAAFGVSDEGIEQWEKTNHDTPNHESLI